MDCEHTSTFSDCVNRFHHVCNSWPLFFEYVNYSSIVPYKKYFVKAWTNKVIHLENTISKGYFCIRFYLIGFVKCSTILLILFVSELSMLTEVSKRYWEAVWETCAFVGM